VNLVIHVRLSEYPYEVPEGPQTPLHTGLNGSANAKAYLRAHFVILSDPSPLPFFFLLLRDRLRGAPIWTIEDFITGGLNTRATLAFFCPPGVFLFLFLGAKTNPLTHPLTSGRVRLNPFGIPLFLDFHHSYREAVLTFGHLLGGSSLQKRIPFATDSPVQKSTYYVTPC